MESSVICSRSGNFPALARCLYPPESYTALYLRFLFDIISVAIWQDLPYNSLAFDFRVPRSNQFLRLPARDLPAEEPFQFNAISHKGTKHHHGNRNSEVV
jgi:hypothetical protein